MSLDHDDILKDSIMEEDLKLLIDVISRASMWVNPNIYKSIKIVYPKTRRKRGVKEKSGQIINGVRLWDNQPASAALWRALGGKISHSHVCHIYEGSVWSPDHFTNLANITAFPKGIASLSEWEPIADVLKYHSYQIYGYKGPEDKIPEKPEYYPKIWENVDLPSQEEIDYRIAILKEQSRNRPTCNKKDSIGKFIPHDYRKTSRPKSIVSSFKEINKFIPYDNRKTSTAIAVWIATATLHIEGKKSMFSAKEIIHKVQTQKLCTSSLATISTHTSSHCVANSKAMPATHRKIYRTHGRYRLYRSGDDFDPSRSKGHAEPSILQLPKEYQGLVSWYHDWCKTDDKISSMI